MILTTNITGEMTSWITISMKIRIYKVQIEKD